MVGSEAQRHSFSSHLQVADWIGHGRAQPSVRADLADLAGEAVLHPPAHDVAERGDRPAVGPSDGRVIDGVQVSPVRFDGVLQGHEVTPPHTCTAWRNGIRGARVGESGVGRLLFYRIYRRGSPG